MFFYTFKLKKKRLKLYFVSSFLSQSFCLEHPLEAVRTPRIWKRWSNNKSLCASGLYFSSKNKKQKEIKSS